MLSRRGFLFGSAAAVVSVGASGYALVEDRVLPGRHWLNSHLGREGRDPGLPDVAPGRLVSGSFVSTHRRGTKVGYTIAYPTTAAARLPFAVVLHGRGVNHSQAFGTGLGLDRFLVAGGHRFALASVDGGDTYWHKRADGEDAGGMVIEEFLPMLVEHGLDTTKVGLLGWSMGAFGALYLAGQLGASRVAAVAAESVAIWHHAGQTAPGAFDDPVDFAACDVFTHQSALAGIPLRIDCGTDDGFYPADRDYVASLRPKPAGGWQTGAHDQAYWRRTAPAQLSFLAQHLT